MTGSDGFTAAVDCAGAAGGVTFGGMMMAAGGRATDCGVMKRGAGLGSTGVTGEALATGGAAAGFGVTTDVGAAAAVFGGCKLIGADGRAGTCGWAAFCVIAFSTSPGLEICDRSILGLNSSTGALARMRDPPVGSPCSA
jgi:hypothetical protein